jgi:hypothetical protein
VEGKRNMKVITTIIATETGIEKSKLTRKALQEYYNSVLKYMREEFKEDTHDISIQVDIEEE